MINQDVFWKNTESQKNMVGQMRAKFDQARNHNSRLMESLGHTKLAQKQVEGDRKFWALKHAYIRKVENEKLVTPNLELSTQSPWKQNSKKKGAANRGNMSPRRNMSPSKQKWAANANLDSTYDERTRQNLARVRDAVIPEDALRNRTST